MSRVTQIVAQRDAGLISIAETRIALDAHKRQARFNSTYADHIGSVKRWDREADAAARALAAL